MSNVLHAMTSQKGLPTFRAEEVKSHVCAFILLPTEVILIKFRSAGLKCLWKTASVAATSHGLRIVYHTSTAAFTTFLNLELNLSSTTIKGGAVSAGVKLISLQLAALQGSIVPNPRFLFPLLTRNDILVYPNPHHGLL
jgi:hypothetical protein